MLEIVCASRRERKFSSERGWSRPRGSSVSRENAVSELADEDRPRSDAIAWKAPRFPPASERDQDRATP